MFADGHAVAIIDRGDYYQIAYLIQKGTDAQMRAEGVTALRRNVAAAACPGWRTGSTDLASLDDVKLLDVQLNRLRSGTRDGLLLIGDAAHAMSPVGGVGINLAVADAVAAARILAGPLRAGAVSPRDLARVQARRWAPAALIQRVQRLVHNSVLEPLGTSAGDRNAGSEPPLPLARCGSSPRFRPCGVPSPTVWRSARCLNTPR